VGDDLIEFIDGQPFYIALKNAVEIRWSGILRAVKDSEQVGVVVMRDGHIAWAVSNAQTENFGSFLERIGMVPKEKLDEVIKKYRSLGKSKKLGALLEEAGLISHATLRECLKAHVRAAISSLMEDPGISLEARHGEMIIDASLVFLLSEVLQDSGDEGSGASMEDETAPEEDFGQVDRQNNVPRALTALSALPGYQYSFVADMSGVIHALHMGDDVQVDVDNLVPPILPWLSIVCRNTPEIKMGRLRFTFLDCDAGSMYIRMIDDDNRFFLAVACDRNAKMGVAMHKISETAEALGKETEQHLSDPY